MTLIQNINLFDSFPMIQLENSYKVSLDKKEINKFDTMKTLISFVIDPIYDFSKSIKIDEITLKIIKTREFQRLKGIKQAGISGFFTNRKYDRYEHSVGVYLLLRYLGASIEQCIGGLLHDIYHTNFSHTTDELFCENGTESFHEKNKYVFFKKCCGNISKILMEHFPQYKVNYFLEGANLIITKDKCFGADMLDYFIRDGYYENVLSMEWINNLISNLKLFNGKIILTDFSIAKDFVNKTIFINDTYYMSSFSRGQYNIFVSILKLALEKNIITTDLLIYGNETDEHIYRLIKFSKNKEIDNLIDFLENTDYESFSYKKKNENWKQYTIITHRKLRYLNPLCLQSDIFNQYHMKYVSLIDSKIEQYIKMKLQKYIKTKFLYVNYCKHGRNIGI